MMSFLVVAYVFGGTATNGKVVAGFYYLGGHGKYIAVSQAVFLYSYFHERSAEAVMIFVTIYAVIKAIRNHDNIHAE